MKKYPFQETEATRYGNQVHEAIELYIRDQKPIPPEYEQFKPVVDAMLKKPGRKLAEYEMALRADLTPTNWKAPDVWVRGIADILIVDDENLTAWVGDWKTGNNKYPDRDQLVLMSLMVFQHFPHIRKVNSALLFIVKNDMVKMCHPGWHALTRTFPSQGKGSRHRLHEQHTSAPVSLDALCG